MKITQKLDRKKTGEVQHEQRKIGSTNYSISGPCIQGNGYSCGKSPCFHSHADCAMNDLVCFGAEYVSRATEKELMFISRLKKTIHAFKDLPEQ